MEVYVGFAWLFLIKSKPDSFPFDLFQPSVYELVRQPNFASLSIIVEDFVKDSGATFSGMSLSCCPALHILWLCCGNECLCQFYTAEQDSDRISPLAFPFHGYKYPSGLGMMSVLRISAAKYCVWGSGQYSIAH